MTARLAIEKALAGIESYYSSHSSHDLTAASAALYDAAKCGADGMHWAVLLDRLLHMRVSSPPSAATMPVDSTEPTKAGSTMFTKKSPLPVREFIVKHDDFPALQVISAAPSFFEIYARILKAFDIDVSKRPARVYFYNKPKHSGPIELTADNFDFLLAEPRPPELAFLTLHVSRDGHVPAEERSVALNVVSVHTVTSNI